MDATMGSMTAKTIMTVVAGIAAAAAFVPQFAPYQAALTALAGFLGGGAHVPRPGDLAQVRDAKAALAQAVESEK